MPPNCREKHGDDRPHKQGAWATSTAGNGAVLSAVCSLSVIPNIPLLVYSCRGLFGISYRHTGAVSIGSAGGSRSIDVADDPFHDLCQSHPRSQSSKTAAVHFHKRGRHGMRSAADLDGTRDRDVGGGLRLTTFCWSTPPRRPVRVPRVGRGGAQAAGCRCAPAGIG
jgi:hypothetical protein